METGIRGDEEWGSIPVLVRAAAARHGDAEALVDGGVRLSFADLAREVDRAGRAFVAAGL
jgi:HIP---CoA ligase